jgi:hypothetical protein
MCPAHYKELQRSAGYVPRKGASHSEAELRAQKGENLYCVDCSEQAWMGGMRCKDCFYRRVQQRRGEHLTDARIGIAGYIQGCRCSGCREGAAAQRKHYRDAAA